MTSLGNEAQLAPKELWQRDKKGLLLALGNDILGDDAVGHLVAREAATRLDPLETDVVETGEAGLALLEQLAGYDQAVIVDAFETAEYTPGTVLVYGVDDFRDVVAPSPHYAGLPEVFDLARRLHLPMPEPMKVVAITVLGPFAFGHCVSPDVEAAIPEAVDAVLRVLGERS